MRILRVETRNLVLLSLIPLKWFVGSGLFNIPQGRFMTILCVFAGKDLHPARRDRPFCGKNIFGGIYVTSPPPGVQVIPGPTVTRPGAGDAVAKEGGNRPKERARRA